MTTSGHHSLAPGRVVVRDLAFRYPPLRSDLKAAQALDGVSFHAEAGQVVGIYGTASSGKSTLCLALNGVVPQVTGGTIRGEVTIGGWSTRSHPVAHLASRVGMVFQDPATGLIGRSVEDEIAFGPENLCVPPAEIERRIVAALHQVGMSAHRFRSSAQLSGGEHQRVAIAAALAMQPAVLVLDEPTAALDPQGTAAVLDVLRALVAERRTTIILVAQDPNILALLSDELLVLDAGRVVLRGAPHQVLAQVTELRRLGLAAPALVELAQRLNLTLGTRFTFQDHPTALRNLTLALKGDNPVRTRRSSPSAT